MKFEDLEWHEHPRFRGAEQAIALFPNGYSLSILYGGSFYCTNDTYEVAVMHDGKLCYDTELTDDVLGYQTKDEVNELLKQCEALTVREVID